MGRKDTEKIEAGLAAVECLTRIAELATVLLRYCRNLATRSLGMEEIGS